MPDEATKKIEWITQERVRKFIHKSEFQDINLTSILYDVVKKDGFRMEIFRDPTELPNGVPPPDSAFLPAGIGHRFGPSWTVHWLRLSFTVPTGGPWGGEIRLLFSADCEALVYWNGAPLEALCELDDKQSFELPGNAKGDVVFLIELACSRMYGNTDGSVFPPDDNRYFTIQRCELAVPNRSARSLWTKLESLLDIYNRMSSDTLQGSKALKAANDIVNAVVIKEPQTVMDGLRIADKYFESFRNGRSPLEITCVGHCHIDTAWLWRYKETKHKVARSWATQLRHMERHPSYTFCASQAQQYEWLAKYYPQLLESIKAQPRFFPVGATWVEMDGNLPSGESFVRQFLYGQRFFKRHFGKYCDVFFLPDTFGYSAQLPQILRQSNCKYFLTQKLSWNLINKPRLTTFFWEGLDGSRVIAHFPPGDSYTSMVRVWELNEMAKNHKQKDISPVGLMLFGHGDGGGGPSEEMLERFDVLQDIDGLPRLTMGSPSELFEKIEKTSSELPYWSGELYFEMHRGTLTSQAAIKELNRRCEGEMQRLEFEASVLFHVSGQNRVIEIGELWKIILCNQFHDVLPGSCIESVAQDAVESYRTSLSSIAALRAEVERQLAREGEGPSVVNATGVNRAEVITVAGSQVAVQVPPYSILPLDRCARTPTGLVRAGPREGGTGYVLENDVVTATFRNDGALISFVAKATGRDFMCSHQELDEFRCDREGGNRLVLYEDIPLYWDAWDVEFYHLQKPLHVAEGEFLGMSTSLLTASLQFRYHVTDRCIIQQVVSLHVGDAHLTFETSVDWKESRKILKVEFATNLRSACAQYEVQHGFLSRPTHTNTSYDFAQFEVACQRWGALSEPAAGVALLNDSKYGMSCLRSKLALSLLRAPKGPDANCDMGVHTFTYALMAHSGKVEDITHLGIRLNSPLGLIEGHHNVDTYAVASHPQIIIDCIKICEDRPSIIVRAFECTGARVCATLRVRHHVTGGARRAAEGPGAFRVNCLEEREGPALATVDDGEWRCVDVRFGAFQLVSVEVVLGEC